MGRRIVDGWVEKQSMFSAFVLWDSIVPGKWEAITFPVEIFTAWLLIAKDARRKEIAPVVSQPIIAGVVQRGATYIDNNGFIVNITNTRLWTIMFDVAMLVSVYCFLAVSAFSKKRPVF